jgi:quercetin dioxygenase-like cupin family protein
VSGAVVVPAGGGEIVGDSPDRRVEILSDRDSLAATWTRFGPGREGADLHVHREHSDLFYVLAGELTVRLGVDDELVTVPAGMLARIPPLVVHGFRNAGAGELRLLNLHAPGLRFADYLRGIRDGRPFPFDQHDPPADGGRPVAEAFVSSRGGVGPASDRDGLRVVSLAEAEAISVAETSAAAGASEPPHVHEGETESLYVLEGELTVTAGGRELRAPAGAWMQVPPGVTHALAAAGPARFLAVHTPG